METKEVLEQIEGKFKEMTKGFAIDADTKAEIKELKDEFKSLKKEIKDDVNASNEEKFKALETIAEQQGTIIAGLKASKIENADKLSIYDQVKGMFTTHQDKYEAFKQKSAPFQFELKAAGTITYSNITGSTTLLPTPEMTPGYNAYRRNPATFLINVGTTNSARIAYVDQGVGEGVGSLVNPLSGTVAEGGAKLATDSDYAVSYSSAVKVAAITKISDEMLDDIDFMAQAVSDDLVSKVELALSGNIYTYVTSGMTPGYTEVSSDFLDYFALARQATVWDILNAAKATIEKGNHTANTVFVSPTTFAIMNMQKTNTGDYTLPLLVTPTSMMFAGMNIISTNAVAGDSYLVCDISKLNIKMYKPLVVEAGWENDDFTKNLRTFRGECRAHYYVKGNDKTAFLFGDLSVSTLYMTAAV